MNYTRFLQTPFWASFKQNNGWVPYYFIQTEDDVIKVDDINITKIEGIPLTVLVRSFSIKVKRFSIAYIPMAPEWDENDDELSFLKLLELRAHLLKKYLPDNTICIRYDPPVDFETEEDRTNARLIFDKTIKQNKIKIVKTNVDIQPPDTTILDLTKSEDDLLSAMKNKWRYNIRLAEKKGVQVTRHFGNDNDFESAFNAFYTLFEETSKRDGVNFHKKDYYIELLKRGCPKDSPSSDSPLVTLYLAKHEDDYLAGIITVFMKNGEAIYLYGASGNVKRNFMPAYLLQWTAIKDAKKYEATSYDFYGMPPNDNPNHPMHGLYLFKTGFGGAIIHRIGTYDVPLRSFDYNLYTTAERIRAFYFKKLVKLFKHR